MTDRKPRIMGIGEVLWDYFPDRRVLGGAPLNFVHHARELGAESWIVSAVGRDSLGNETLAAIEEREIHTCITRNDSPTGTVQVGLDARGVPTYHFPAPVAWDFIETAPFSAQATETDACCFGTFAQRSEVSRRNTLALLAALPERVLKVLDLNLRGDFYTPETILTSLGLCDLLKINDEELEVLTPMLELSGTPQERCRELRRRDDLQMVILTCGTAGSWLFTSRKESFLPTPRVRLSDTVGAGDSFLAAVVTGVLRQRPLRELHRHAVALSAFVCTRPGGTPAHDPDTVELILSQVRDYR